jgi:hypothetical protein
VISGVNPNEYSSLNFQNARCDWRFLASQIQWAALRVGKFVGYSGVNRLAEHHLANCG